MKTSVDDRGNIIVSLDNELSKFINENIGYVPNAPEFVSWAPEWLVVPELEFYITGELQTIPAKGTTYLPYPGVTIKNFYGGSVLDPNRIAYPENMPPWTVIETEFEPDESGLYYVATARQGFSVYIEKFVLDILKMVHPDEFANEGSEIPIIPAWKEGRLVARMIPFTKLEQYLIEPPFQDPSEYVEIIEEEDPTDPSRKVRQWYPREGITFEEMLSAGHHLEDAKSAVIVEKPFSLGVVYGWKKGITSTFTPPAQGLPPKFVEKIIEWYKNLEKLGGAGNYYLPVGNYVIMRTCAADFEPPRAYLLPSAWTYILDIIANAPTAYLYTIVNREKLHPELHWEQA